MTDESGIKLSLVMLQNVLLDSGFVHLEMINTLDGRLFHASLIVRPQEEDCTWMLLDMDYFNEKIRKKKTGKYKGDNNLLEFEF
jgi:hypothetical protein